MPEEERLSLVSEVEDEFTEPLERLEQSLDAVDDAIRHTGRGRDHVRIDVEVSSGDAVGELEALDAAVEAIDDDVDIDVDGDNFDDGLFQGGPNLTDDEAMGVADMFNPKSAFRQTPGLGDGGDSEAVADGDDGMEMFSVENIGDWADALGPYLDRGALAERGGEVSRLEMAMDRDLGETIDLDDVVRRAVGDDDHIDSRTVRGLTGGPGDVMDALTDIDRSDSNLTLLGDNTLRRNFRRLKKEVADLRFTMGGFHQIIAAMVPLVGVFVGALPAAIVGVGALATAAIGAAAALAGVGALGAVGIMMTRGSGLSTEPLMAELREVGDAFLDAFAPLAESFAPLVQSAIGSVKRMAGPLADASAALLAFRDEWSASIGFLTSAVPSFTREFLAFTHAAEPIVSGIVSTVSGIDWFGFFATELSNALPALIMLGQAVMQIVPALVHLSQGFLVVAAAISQVVGFVAFLMNQFPLLTTIVGAVVGAFLTLITATTLYTIATSGLMAASLGLAKSLIFSVVPSLKATALNFWTSAVAAWGLQRAIAAVIATATLGVGVIALFAREFSKLGGNVNKARRELDRFANARNAMNTGIPTGGTTPTGRASNTYVDQSTTVIQAGDQDAAARQQYNSQYEQQQYRDSVFGSG